MSGFLRGMRSLGGVPRALLVIGLVLLLGMGSAVAADMIGSGRIKDRSIRARDIATGAATSRVIQRRAVKRADLGSEAVTSRSVANGTVARQDLSADVQSALDSAGNGPVRVTQPDIDGSAWSYSANTVCGGGDSTASEGFANGTQATPPLGTGSIEFRIGANGNSYVRRGTDELNGVRLTDLLTLRYSTLVQSNSSGQAPYMLLNVDNDNDGQSDDTLFFEPVYQTGAYSGDPVPNQGDVTNQVWQTWNARVGGWWSQAAGNFGPPLTTLDSYAAAHDGDTTIVQGSSAGLRVVAGCGAPAWDGFIGNFDDVEFGTSKVAVYDFERI